MLEVGVADLPVPKLEKCELGGIPLLTDEALFEACSVRIAFAGRWGGVSEGPWASLNTGSNTDDDPMNVARNRRALLSAIGATAVPLIVPKQVHGTRVLHVAQMTDVGPVASDALDGADAVQVDVPGVASMLNFADCLPLVLVAPSGRFSVVHAGWRGALARIASAAVRELAKGGEDPRTFNAYIGPHIGAECFEVGDDVAARFADEFGPEVVLGDDKAKAIAALRDKRQVGAAFVDYAVDLALSECAAETPGPKHVDLTWVVVRDLMSAGMDPGSVCDCGICTACHTEGYFSFRATDGVCGRQAAVAYRMWD